MDFAHSRGALHVLDAANEQRLASASPAASVECFLRDFAALFLLPLGVASDQDLKVVLGELGTIVRHISDLLAGNDFAGENLAEVLSPTDVYGRAVGVATADNSVSMNSIVGSRRQPMN